MKAGGPLADSTRRSIVPKSPEGPRRPALSVRQPAAPAVQREDDTHAPSPACMHQGKGGSQQGSEWLALASSCSRVEAKVRQRPTPGLTPWRQRQVQKPSLLRGGHHLLRRGCCRRRCCCCRRRRLTPTTPPVPCAAAACWPAAEQHGIAHHSRKALHRRRLSASTSSMSVDTSVAVALAQALTVGDDAALSSCLDGELGQRLPTCCMPGQPPVLAAGPADDRAPAALLHPATAVQDAAVVDATTHRLAPPQAQALLTALVDRLRRQPQQAACLAPWLRSLLLAQGAGLAATPVGQVRPAPAQRCRHCQAVLGNQAPPAADTPCRCAARPAPDLAP